LFFNDQSTEGIAIKREILKLDKSEHLTALIVHYFHSLMQYQYHAILKEWIESPKVSHTNDKNEKFNILFDENNDTLLSSLVTWSQCQVAEDGTIVPLENLVNIEENEKSNNNTVQHTIDHVLDTLIERKRSKVLKKQSSEKIETIESNTETKNEVETDIKNEIDIKSEEIEIKSEVETENGEENDRDNI